MGERLSARRDAGRAGAAADSPRIVDLHVDTILWAHDDGADLAAGHPVAHVDVPRLRAGGVGAVFFAAWVHPAFVERGVAFARARSLLECARRLTSESTQLELAVDVAGVERASESGKIALGLGVEGGHAIEDSLERLAELATLSARYLTLTWTNTNGWADAAGDERRHGGLAPFGREVVRRMNDLGMMVDVSHVSDETFFDALEASDAPVIASHSAVRSLAPHPRNLSDEMLRALGQQGGVVGIPFYSHFLDPAFDEPYRSWRAEVQPRADAAWARFADEPGRAERAAQRVWLAEATRLPRVSLEWVVRHIDRAAELAGIDHVAIGSDFDGILHTPDGLEHAGRIPNLIEALRRRGYDAPSLRKVLGLNALRVWDEAGRRARV